MIRAIAAVAAALITTVVFAFAILLLRFGIPVVFGLLPQFDWAVVFFFLFLIGYFVAALPLWQEALRNARSAKLRDYIEAIPVFFLMPAGSVFAYAVVLPHMALKNFLLRYLLDPSWNELYDRCVGALIIVWTSIYGILLFSNLWQPAEDQCRWIFPKIMTCLLVKHDGLAGGVIGAGGGIFAAWLAWTAIQKQIGSAEQEK
jgi:hypothetical protein